jgi:MOSC domain-containing protein YiiM
MTSADIISINIGLPASIKAGNRKVLTGIYKSPVNNALYLAKLNFQGDGQGDLEHHGGLEKAVCVYPEEHYPYWEKELHCKLTPGAFGENLTTRGLIEENICIGDIFKLGEAIVQVSQPRRPCYKLSIRYQLEDLPLRFQNTGYTGFYLRVLQEGIVSVKDKLILAEPHPHRITVGYANQIMHHDRHNQEGIHKLLAVKELAENWRRTFLKRLAGQEEDQKNRLTGQ